MCELIEGLADILEQQAGTMRLARIACDGPLPLKERLARVACDGPLPLKERERIDTSLRRGRGSLQYLDYARHPRLGSCPKLGTLHDRSLDPLRILDPHAELVDPRTLAT